MWSSRTVVVVLEDKNRGLGLGLGLDKAWPCPWPRHLALNTLAFINTRRIVTFT